MRCPQAKDLRLYSPRQSMLAASQRWPLSQREGGRSRRRRSGLGAQESSGLGENAPGWAPRFACCADGLSGGAWLSAQESFPLRDEGLNRSCAHVRCLIFWTYPPRTNISRRSEDKLSFWPVKSASTQTSKQTHLYPYPCGTAEVRILIFP